LIIYNSPLSASAADAEDIKNIFFPGITAEQPSSENKRKVDIFI